MVLENFSPQPRPQYKRFRLIPNGRERFIKGSPPESVGHLTVGPHFSVVSADNYGAVFILAFLSLWREVVECSDLSERHTSDAELSLDTTSRGFCIRLVSRLQS